MDAILSFKFSDVRPGSPDSRLGGGAPFNSHYCGCPIHETVSPFHGWDRMIPEWPTVWIRAVPLIHDETVDEMGHSDLW